MGGIDRLRTADAFAARCEVAPIRRSSGQVKRARLNAGGNRRLNNALNINTLVRLRLRPESRAYLARKLAEGKNQRAAICHFKILIAGRRYRLLDEVGTIPPVYAAQVT